MITRNETCTALLVLCVLNATGRAETLAVEFLVPAGVQGTEEAECIVTPNFSANFQRTEVYDAIKALMGADGTVTLLRSSTEEVLERRGPRIEGLWEKAQHFKKASCVSKCVQLPMGVQLSQLRFTDEDGLNECLRSPIDRGHLPSMSNLSCGNTAWRDIVLAKDNDNGLMLCATAVAWLTIPATGKKTAKKSEMPTTKNRVLLDYEIPR